jgi:glyoxylase-like metal-dependent hydrolase (beta-lactamase superfamily II)
VTEALAPLVTRMPEGVLAAQLPTPFPVGPVNCYLLPEHPVTLVDPGMLWDNTPKLIEAFLASAGRRVQDVELVVVTHGHPDHFGAAGWVAQHADAPIVCGRDERAKLVEGYRSGRFRLSDFAVRLGMPDEVVASLPGFLELVLPMIHEIHDDDLILVDDLASLRAGGRNWTVQVTPGHAVGHVSLYDSETGTLLAGDHLLARITPNPMMEPDEGSDLGRRRSLVEYLASLERFVALDPQVALTGHGPAFTDVKSWAAAVRSHHDARANHILDIVRELNSPTAFELSSRLFPTIEGFSHMLGISEVIGHLDLLADTGTVGAVGDAPIRYVCT